MALLSDPDQTITTELAVAECCPAALATPIVQIAHEMIGKRREAWHAHAPGGTHHVAAAGNGAGPAALLVGER